MTDRLPRIPHDGTPQPQRTARAVERVMQDNLPEGAGSSVKKTGIAVSVAAVKILHGLGHPVRGWRTTRIRSAMGIGLGEVTSDEQTITIVATGTATVDLEIW